MNREELRTHAAIQDMSRTMRLILKVLERIADVLEEKNK